MVGYLFFGRFSMPCTTQWYRPQHLLVKDSLYRLIFKLPNSVNSYTPSFTVYCVRDSTQSVSVIVAIGVEKVGRAGLGDAISDGDGPTFGVWSVFVSLLRMVRS